MPVDDAALAAIDALGTQAAIRRMDTGTTPEGQPFKPLSRRYVKRKGHAKFWVGPKRPGHKAGASKASLRAGGTVAKRGVTTSIRWIINTPYSGIVHDGGTIHVTRRSSSLKARADMHDRHDKARKARVKSIMASYGIKRVKGMSTGSYHELQMHTLQAHAMAQRKDGIARRRQGIYQRDEQARANMGAGSRAGWAVRRGLAVRLPKRDRMSWTVHIPPRPVLGFSAKDKIGVGRILAASAKRRMEGGNA